jgi:DNA polymerase-1
MKDAYKQSIRQKDKTELKDLKTFITKLLEYKKKVKLHKTYVKGIGSAIEYNEEPRIYSNYNVATVVTGRLSCSTYSVGPSQKKGVSFHTLPRTVDDTVNIRKLMTADEDKVFLAADFSQAELRVLAQCCKDKNLIKAFNSGQDLHSFTASLIYSKPISKITKQERQVAKSVSFLIVYGGGPGKLSLQINKPLSYCKNIFKEYQNSFPGVFKWMNYVHKYVRANGYAVSLFGRRRNLPNVKSPVRALQHRALRQGMNFVIQSSASDMMLHSIKRLQESIINQKVEDMSLLATVHDSVEAQCDSTNLEEKINLMHSSLTDMSDLKDLYGLELVIPFEVDIEVGTSFGNVIEAKIENGKVHNMMELLQYVENC